jgi:anti-anti-sigma regulatory factor
MAEIARGWELSVERGPNWLFVKVLGQPDSRTGNEPLAEQLFRLMEEHFSFRLVLELDEVETLDNLLIRQLALLDDLARSRGGFVRLCGLSPRNWQIVVRNGLGDVFPAYRDREEAVFASHHPRKPR